MSLLLTPLPFYGRDTFPARRWLIDGILPEAELVLLDGPSGVGKSLFAAALTADVSRQPDPRRQPPLTINAWLGADDDVEDLAWPALQRHGYREGGVLWYPFARELDETADPNLADRLLHELKEFITGTRPRLIVLDGLEKLLPFLADAPPLLQRRFWRTLRQIARECGCTVLVLRTRGLHQPKHMNTFARLGAEVARFALTLAWHPHDQSRRILTVAKHQFGPSGGQHLLSIHASGRLAWEPCAADDLARPSFAAVPALTPRRHGPQSFVREIAARLLAFLDGQARPAQEVKQYLATLGYTATSIRKALTLCPLQCERRGNAWWYLVEVEDPVPRTEAGGHPGTAADGVVAEENGIRSVRVPVAVAAPPGMSHSSDDPILRANRAVTQEPGLPSRRCGEEPEGRSQEDSSRGSHIDPRFDAFPTNHTTTQEPLLTTAP